MGWMGIWWILLPLVIGLLVWAVLKNRSGPEMRPPTETPEEILKRRYASGEIDRDTYQRMLDDLRGG
jgi:putative membrane protein